MAIAGPLVNIALAIITWLFITIPDLKELTVQLSGGVNQSNFFLNFFIVNIWLVIFNLVPAFPMDGGRVLRAILSMKFERHIATTIAARIGQLLALAFIFIGFNNNPFLIFIGLFIILAAQAEVEMTKAGFMLKGILVKDVLMKHYETINANDIVEIAVKQLLNGQCKNFLVISDGHPVGSLSRDEIIEALSNNGSKSTIDKVMNRDILKLNTNEPIEIAYQKMLANKNELATVYDNQQFVGVLDVDNILEFIMIKNAVEANK